MAEMSHVDAQAETSSQANTPKDSRPVYEIGFHIVPDVPEVNIGEIVEKIRAQIKKDEAEIINESFPRKIALSYTIERATSGKRDKYHDAYFGFIKFATEREHISELEVLLRDMKEVLRYLLIGTTREEILATPRRVVFSSDRLEGETLKKPTAAPEKKTAVSEEELDKSIEALVS